MGRSIASVSALERAKLDEAAGDLGSARRRLASYVASTGYDPAICEQIARLCVGMHDPHEAGKWYDVSDSSDSDAESCITAFEKSCGGPKGVLGQLPRVALSKALEQYPPRVAARLAIAGYAGAPSKSATRRSLNMAPGSLGDKVMGVGCALGIFVVGSLLVIGVIAVAQWWKRP